MTQKVLLLKGPGFSVVEEVLRLMDTEASCHDLPAYMIGLADTIMSGPKGQLLRQFKAESGAVYPVYITEDEPYVVYAVLNRQADPQIQVLKAGLRNNENAATFFRDVGTEVVRRVEFQGWKL